MRYRYQLLFLILLSLILSIGAHAQNGTIKGTVIDTSLGYPLYQVSVVLLQAKDSFMVANQRTDSAGRFSFTNVQDTSTYILLFTYPKYADYSHVVNLKEAKGGILDLKNISMIRMGDLLHEVVIKGATGAIRLKGDTTEYVADSFKVQPNATVEDLLKQLPGLQVDQYGNITAQGQKVKRVLVDGEEFFSDDPTLVTRNLRADMISRVQVYDKKSDAATFTGIDDGIKEKTINLKIKEDKNHGIFGKAELGAGSDHHYLGQGMLNAFKSKRKMAVYGTTSNIGRVGLGSADKQTIGDNSDADADYNGEGLPKAISTGVHYNNKWNDDKESINGNYKYNWLGIHGNDLTTSQNNLPTGFIKSETSNVFDSHNENHSANGKYIHEFDTTSKITIYADGNQSHQSSSSNGLSETWREDNSRINNKTSTSQNDYRVNSYNLNLSWEKKLKKYGRTISFYLNNNFNHDQSDGSGRSESNFYNTDDLQDSSALLYLAKRMNDNWRTNTLNVNYTEPLSEKLSLLVNYTLENSNVDDDKRSYNLANGTSKDQIDSLFSTRIDESKWGHQAGVSLNYTPRKMIINIGNNIQLNSYNFNSYYSSSSLQRHFTNWNPVASFRYNPTDFQGFYFSYRGSSTNPGRTQLLPYKYSNSQLVTYEANTDLRSSYTHNFSSNYYQSKRMGQVYIGGNMNFNLASNPIILSSEISPSGTYNYQYKNLSSKNNSNYYANIFYGRSIKGLNLQSVAGINGGVMYSEINDALSKLNYDTYSLRLYGGKEIPKSYSVYLLLSGGYTNNNSSLQLAPANSYFFYTLNPSVTIFFLKKLELHTDADYLWQQKTQTFDNNFDRVIWNAWLGYNMLKNDQLTIKISCNDILNQNNGYSRTANNSVYTERTYNTIRRFFMIGATWSFTKFNSLKQQ